MDRNEFAAELRRMASNNGIHFLKDDQILQVLSSDIAAGADFINIIPSFSGKNTFLMINTRSVFSVKTGMFRPKAAWSVPVTQIKSARPARSAFGAYIVDELRIEAASGALEFRFGFFSHMYDGHRAEIAQGNAQVAAHEVTLAVNALRPAGSPTSTPRTPESEQSSNALAAQLRCFIRSLSHLTGTDTVGRLFGEGLGLENAMSLLPLSFDRIETMQEAGEMMAITIIGATGQEQITPEDLHYVMGTSILRDSGLTAGQATAAENLAAAALGFLGQLHEPGASMWELWKNRADVAGEFLCWHAVAWGRLSTLGRVDPMLD